LSQLGFLKAGIENSKTLFKLKIRQEFVFWQYEYIEEAILCQGILRRVFAQGVAGILRTTPGVSKLLLGRFFPCGPPFAMLYGCAIKEGQRIATGLLLEMIQDGPGGEY
jgi:hypothetical protein